MALGWLWWRVWGPLAARDAAALCVAGVAGVAIGDIDLRFALGDIHLRFAWQAWHLATSTLHHAASESITLKYDFVTRNLSHLSLSHMQLYRTQRTQLFHTQLFHTHLSHT